MHIITLNYLIIGLFEVGLRYGNLRLRDNRRDDIAVPWQPTPAARSPTLSCRHLPAFSGSVFRGPRTGRLGGGIHCPRRGTAP